MSSCSLLSHGLLLSKLRVVSLLAASGIDCRTWEVMQCQSMSLAHWLATRCGQAVCSLVQHVQPGKAWMRAGLKSIAFMQGRPRMREGIEHAAPLG